MYCDECKDQAHAAIDELQEQINRLREAQRCASCGGTICPPMQCGHCIEKEEPVPGMVARPATTNLREKLQAAQLQNGELKGRLEEIQHIATLFWNGKPEGPLGMILDILLRKTEKRISDIPQAFKDAKAWVNEVSAPTERQKCDMQAKDGSCYCTRPEGHEGDHRSFHEAWDYQWKRD